METIYGGLCVFIRRGIQVSVVDLSSYKSCELLLLHTPAGHLSSVFVVIYHPPSPLPSENFCVNIGSQGHPRSNLKNVKNDILEPPVSTHRVVGGVGASGGWGRWVGRGGRGVRWGREGGVGHR